MPIGYKLFARESTEAPEHAESEDPIRSNEDSDDLSCDDEPTPRARLNRGLWGCRRYRVVHVLPNGSRLSCGALKKE